MLDPRPRDEIIQTSHKSGETLNSQGRPWLSFVRVVLSPHTTINDRLPRVKDVLAVPNACVRSRAETSTSNKSRCTSSPR